MEASNQPRVLSVLIRVAIWLCASSLAPTALLAQCTNPTLVPDGTHVGGDHSRSDNNALKASNFSVSQSASATFSAGNCIHLAPGFRANAVGASVSTTFQTWVEAAPIVESSVPSNGSGFSQTFTWTVSNPSGSDRVSEIYAFFATGFSTAVGTCQIRYIRSTNMLYLLKDGADGWLGGIALGSNQSVGNSQCSFTGLGSSVNAAGTQLALRIPVTFNPNTYAGTKGQFAYAQEISGMNSTWQSMGTWNIPPPPADFVLSATQHVYQVPPPGYSSSPTFTLNLAPLNGFNSLVTFSFSPYLLGCASSNFAPSPQNYAPSTTTFTLQCGNLAPGGYSTIVTATGGGISKEVVLAIHKAAPAPRWMLTTAVSPAGGGYVSPQVGEYPNGSSVLVTAVPYSGYSFTSFSGVNSSSGNTGSVTMTGHRHVVATFTPLPQLTVAAPSLSPAPGQFSGPQTITITPNTIGASTRYTVDGGTPSPTTGIFYTGPFQVNTSTIVRAISFMTGMTPSAVTSGTYTISNGVAAPGFNPPAGTYTDSQSVVLSKGASEDSIRYTTNGATPTATVGDLYTGPIPVNATTTIKAYAYRPGMTDSPIISSLYNITPMVAAAPVFSPFGGSYASAQNVTITTTTFGAAIRYTVGDTVNGSSPTSTTGTLYTGPVTVSGPGSKTIRAIAYRPNTTDSPVSSATFVFQSPASTSREYIRVNGRLIAIESVQQEEE